MSLLVSLLRQFCPVTRTSARGVPYVVLSAATHGVPLYVRLCRGVFMFTYTATRGVLENVSLWRGVGKCGNPRRSVIHQRGVTYLSGNPWRSEVRSNVSAGQLAASDLSSHPYVSPWRAVRGL